jgi:hypothetical protein
MRFPWRSCVALAALLQLGAVPAKKKPDSPARQAATKRAAELGASLAKQKVAGFVVLGRNAFSSKETARSSKDPGAGALAIDTSSARGGRGATVWKVVSDQGDLVEVRSLPATTPGHCHGGGAADPVEVRAFARKTDLLPVLAAEQTERYQDGTVISFAPGSLVGAPVLPRRGGWAVSAAGLTFELKVPAGALTLSYAAPKTFSFKRERHNYKMGFDGRYEPPSFREASHPDVLYLNGAAFARGHQLSDGLREIQSSEAGAREGEELLELASDCVRLKVVGKSAAGDLRGGAAGIGGLGGRQRPTRYRIAKGTALTYPDGSAAGATLADIVEENPSRAGTRLCFSFRVEVDSPLCVAAATTKEEP